MKTATWFLLLGPRVIMEARHGLETVLQSPFFTVALPIVVTLILGIVVQNKRIDDLRADMNRQFDAVNHRLDKIEWRLGA
jgi:hypothetical protein